MNILLAVKQVAPKNYTFNLSVIQWWHYVVILAIVFFVAGFKNSKWWSSLGVMFSLAVIYVLVVTWVLPHVSVYTH
jgi:hypothetical protein